MAVKVPLFHIVPYSSNESVLSLLHVYIYLFPYLFNSWHWQFLNAFLPDVTDVAKYKPGGV